jgi:DNA-binding beta-propeller fold protein YncE
MRLATTIRKISRSRRVSIDMSIPAPARIARVTLAILVISAIGTIGAACAVRLHRHRVGDGGFAIRAEIDTPSGVAVIGDVVYVSELMRDTIRRIDTRTGLIGTLKTSRPLKGAYSLATDGRGHLLVVELARISRIDVSNGVVTPVAGTGSPGHAGDGGPATAARLWLPSACATDAHGDIYIADPASKRIRRVDAQTGIISTIAGTGGNSTSGDGGPAVAANFEFPNSVAVDAAGNVYVAQSNETPESARIRRIRMATGIVDTVAGPETPVWSDDRQHFEQGIGNPSHLVYDGHGGLLFLDHRRKQLLRLDVESGEVRSIAGGPAEPSSFAIASDGTIIVADFDGNRVYRVDGRTRAITLLAGNGKPKRAIILL